MSLITRAGDLVYTFRFLKLLVTKFEDTDAFKFGIIDAEGKRIKSKKIETSSEKASYTAFHKLVYNIKKLIAKAPGGSSKIASYISALYLLKETYSLSDKNVMKIIRESGFDTLDMLQESSEWFLLDDKQLSPGIYRIKNEKVLSETLDDIVKAKDKVRILEQSYPVDNLIGIDIYEAIHLNTGKKIHIALGEIYR